MHGMKVKADRYGQYKKRMDSMMSSPMGYECVPADMNGHRVFTEKGVDLKDVEKDIRELYDLEGDAGLAES